MDNLGIKGDKGKLLFCVGKDKQEVRGITKSDQTRIRQMQPENKPLQKKERPSHSGIETGWQGPTAHPVNPITHNHALLRFG